MRTKAIPVLGVLSIFPLLSSAALSSFNVYTTSTDSAADLTTRDSSHDEISLPLKIYNNRSSELYAYVTSLDPNGGIYQFLSGADNSWTWSSDLPTNSRVPAYYFTDAQRDAYQIALPSKKNTTLTLPGHIISGRVYVSEQPLRFGTTDAAGNTGLIQPSVSNPSLPEYSIPFQVLEFTYKEDGLYSDISNMDFVSIPLGMVVEGPTTVHQVGGLVENGVEKVCKALQKQADKDGYSWDLLCQYAADGTLVRVLSPSQYLAINPTDPLSHYFEPYVDAVWEHYTFPNILTINTQDNRHKNTAANGINATCTVFPFNSSILTCSEPGMQNTYPFTKPTSLQIFGCTQDQDSPFVVSGAVNGDLTQAEIVPRLCAALHRGTLLLPGGQVQPGWNLTAREYYTNATGCNHYARVVHEYEEGGMGYAFAYDDANPLWEEGLDDATANAAGSIQEASPMLFYITVGN